MGTFRGTFFGGHVMGGDQMMCQRCLLLDRGNMVVGKEGMPVAEIGHDVGPAVTILNGEALCLRHWTDATAPQK